MMRAEEVQKLVGEAISINTNKEYISVINQELLPSFLKDNPRIIVHPGFKHYHQDDYGQKYKGKFEGYEEYLERLGEKTKKDVEQGRSVILYAPKKHLYQTLETIGPLENLIIVPNNGGNTFVDYESLGVSDEEFYKMLSNYVTEAEISGEFNDGCVDSLEGIAGTYIDLYRDNETIFPSDEQLEKWRCRFPVDSLLKVPKKEFLALSMLGGDKFVEELLRAEFELGERLKKEHTIKEGTCLFSLIEYLSRHTGIDEDYETFPHSFLYSIDGMSNWSKRTIRRNIKKMEDMGLVKIRNINDEERKPYKFISLLAKENDLKFSVPRKIIQSNIPIKSSDLDFEEDDLGTSDIKYAIKDLSVQELEELEKIGLKLDRVIDVRGMNQQERAGATLELYSDFKKNSKWRPSEELSDEIKERRNKLIDKTLKKIDGMPHIKQKYVVGSHREKKNDASSDIDIMLVRDYCPGREECYYKLQKGPTDIFCFTEDEMKQLRNKNALIVSGLEPNQS